MSAADPRSPHQSSQRRFAAIPKRRRGRLSDSDESFEFNLDDATRQLTPSELTKAAEELLDHYDNPSKTRSMSGRGKGAALGVLTPGYSSSTLAQDSGHIHESAWSNIADHDCAKEGCFDSGVRSLPEDDRLSDDYTSRGGGKKRKVPASALQGQGSSGIRDERRHSGEESTCVHTCGHSCEQTCDHEEDDQGNGAVDQPNGLDNPDEGCSHSECCCHHSHGDGDEDGVEEGGPVYHRLPQRKLTPARKALAFHKRLMNARKAQILGLHGDASVCLAQTKQQTSSLPSKEELEILTRALEYAGVSGWEGDRVGVGAGMYEGQTPRPRSQVLNSLQRTMMGTTVHEAEIEPEVQDQPVIKLKWHRRGRALERWQWLHREPVPRKGWIPEGSFEFEQRSSVSNILARSLQDLNILRSKVTQLLTLTLNSRPMTNLLMASTKANSTKPPPQAITGSSGKKDGTSATSKAPIPPTAAKSSGDNKARGEINGKATGKASLPPTSVKVQLTDDEWKEASKQVKGTSNPPAESTSGAESESSARARADIKRIIDKVVETINGDPDPAMFEARLRDRPGLDTKFSFLWEKDPNYPYFRHMIETTRKQPAPLATSAGNDRALPVANVHGAAQQKATAPTAPAAPPVIVPAPVAQAAPAPNSATPAATAITAAAAPTKPAAISTKKINTNPDVKIEPSFTEPDYVAPPSNKKKPKKKKKTSFANASNPHHVKNYVPSRRPAIASNEPVDIPDLLERMLFPAATRFLAARPPGLSGTNEADYRIAAGGGDGGEPGDEEYVCCFCEYDLFFGSKDLMAKGVERRRKLLEKRNRVSEKAKGVLEGKGLGKIKSNNNSGTTAAAGKKAADPKEPYKGEEGCPGGDQCRCNEIRAEKAAAGGTVTTTNGAEPNGVRSPEPHPSVGLQAEILNDAGEVVETGVVSAVYPPGTTGFEEVDGGEVRTLVLPNPNADAPPSETDDGFVSLHSSTLSNQGSEVRNWEYEDPHQARDRYAGTDRRSKPDAPEEVYPDADEDYYTANGQSGAGDLEEDVETELGSPELEGASPLPVVAYDPNDPWAGVDMDAVD